MAGLEIKFQGRVRDAERHTLAGVLGRYGFALEQCDGGKLIVARRPDVIERDEFKQAIVASSADTAYYAGVAWGALRSWVRHKELGYDWPEEQIPASFASNSWTDGMYARELLIAESMPPTVGWAMRNTHLRGVNKRLASAWAAVASTYPPEAEY